MARPADPQKPPALERTLSLFSLVMMGMGMMIGAGVFVASGISMAKGGCGAVIIAFALNGLIALFTAMSYAELSSAIPRAGGPYNWASYGFGRVAGFMTGWMEWLAATVAGSLYAVTFGHYTVKFGLELAAFELPAGVETWVVKGVALAVALTFVYVNYRGASEAGKAGVIMALGQMITLGLIVVAAAFAVGADPQRIANFHSFLPAGWGKVLVAMGLTYVAFEGFEVICQAGDEAIEPRRNIPKALFYSLIGVVTVYILLSLAMTVGVEGTDPMSFFREGHNPSVRFADAIKNIMPAGALVVTIAVIFSATSALNATVYSATRICYALGRDKFLPRAFSSISAATRVPSFALAVTATLLVLIAVTLPIEHVAAAASILFIFVFMMGNAALIKIRKDASHVLKYGYVMPLFPFLALIAIGVQISMIVRLFVESSWTWPVVFGWIGLGLIAYLGYSRTRAQAQTLPVVTLEQRTMPRRREFSILVPIANPANVQVLMESAIRIARRKEGEIFVLNYIRIPELSPVEAVEQYLPESKRIVEGSLAMAPEDVPVHTEIKYGHDFVNGIMQTIGERDIDLLLLGWRGRSSFYYNALGSSIDPVVENAACNVVVVRTDRARARHAPVRRVLIPSGGRSINQTLLAIDVGRSLVADDGLVTFWTVRAPAQTERSARNALQTIVDYARGTTIDVSVSVAEPGEICESILAESRNHDLLIIGATQHGVLKKKAFGEIPEAIAHDCRADLVMVKAMGQVESFINRWLGR